MSKESLSVTISDAAVQTFPSQIERLREFVRSQLKEGVDYDQLPGTPKKSLLKPGAEKLARIFHLGSRVIDQKTDIDHQKGFGHSTVVIEVFDIRTGYGITQSAGSANTFEPSHRSKHYSVALNHILKMAIKRAFVGAIVSAVGASDFFTQDIEENAGEPKKAVAEADEPVRAAPAYEGSAGSFRVPFGRNQGLKLEDLPQEELDQLEKWVSERSKPTGKVLQCKLAIDKFRSPK